jgi:hypothetical protein
MDTPTLQTEPLLSPRALNVLRQGRDPGQVIVHPDGSWEHPPLYNLGDAYERLLAAQS